MIRRLLALGLLGLAACSGGDAQPEPPLRALQSTGRVQGQLTVFQGAGQQSQSMPLPRGGPSARELSRVVSRALPKKQAPVSSAARSAPRVPALPIDIPGEVILRFEEPNLTPEQVLQRVKTPGYRAVHQGYASEYLHLVAFERGGPGRMSASGGRALSVEETGRLVTRLAARPGVRFAEPNRRMRSFAVPNDGAFPYQWHYFALNLPPAWDVPEAPGVVVAVVDTGIVAHPDLVGRLLPGIDMISDPAMAGDGDGRDADPTDLGADLPEGRSSWHGTHVAGTIGATTNNGIGVAGVSWGALVLPVRVLGRGGGTTLDIAAGMQWAAGGTVPGLPVNATPAKVINLSLGGPQAPTQVYQDVIDERVAAGALFVVAAGNEGQDAALFTPCNQESVICVGATSLIGVRSSFSNFGAPVDVVAPGGELNEDLNGDGYPDGVLSTMLDEAGFPTYLFREGTSMAAPHVAGVLALLASQRPDLDISEAELILRATAVPSAQCIEGCGAGLVNAQAALRALQPGPVVEPPRLAVNTGSLFFTGDGALPVLVYNQGGGDLVVTASVPAEAAGVVSFPFGDTVTVPALSAEPLGVAVTLTGLAPGDYEVPVTLSSAAGAVTVAVRLRVGGLAAQDAAVVLLYLDEQGNWQSAPELVTVAPAAAGYLYAIDVVPRTYYVTAAIDDDQDGEYFEDGERIGFWRNVDSVEPIEVRAGEVVDGINFDLVPFIPVSGAP